jgi:TonB family protein
MRRFSILCFVSTILFGILQSSAYGLTPDPCNQECRSKKDKSFVKARIISIPASSFVYPKQLIAVGAEGNTVLLLTVSKTGNLEKVELSESSGFEALDSAAIKGVKLCKFSPSTKNGEKVESKIIWKYIWRVPVGQ